MTAPMVQQIPVPGSAEPLRVRREADGRLLVVEGGGRTYLRADERGRTFGDGLAFFSETAFGSTLLRYVRTPGGSWTERYLLDDAGRPVHVDGVDVRRDARGRVVSCVGPTGTWRYAYDGDALAEIGGPAGRRRLEWDASGRLARAAEEGGRVRRLLYGADGRRLDVPRPPCGWHRDGWGRLWTVTSPDGRILHTYLWDGFACLGRIDGPLGAPLAAVFSLDPTHTPVRIVTPEGTVRVFRDAFGEALLAHPGVPGLHGGSAHRGFVYLRARTLDPRLGSYDRPDPWHGGGEDPRRAEGYRGMLPVEAAPPYAVCQHDPVGRVDPTGESSAGLAFLVHFFSLTWSMQNNVLGWLGLDWSINFWGSLITGFQLGNFFDFQGFTGQRQHTFAVRRAGVLSTDRAWTFQHILWNEKDHIDELADVHVVDPLGRWVPSVYGTVLRIRYEFEKQETRRILAGDRMMDAPGVLTWTRAGGIGEPVCPGTETPWFPRGGLHLDSPIDGLRAYEPIPCNLAELEPTGSFFTASFDGHRSLIVPAARIEGGATALDGRLVLLTDPERNAAILLIERVETLGDDVHLWLVEAPVIPAGAEIRVRALPTAPVSTEDLPVRPGGLQLDLNGVAGGPADYAAGQPFRFVDPASSGVLGAALLQGFETGLTLTAALTAGLREPFEIETMTRVRSGTATFTGAVGEIAVLGGSIPAAGSFLLLTFNGNELIVRVTRRTGSILTVEPDLFALGGTQTAGETINWEELAPTNTVIGRRAEALDGAALDRFVYAGTAARAAPAPSSFVMIRDAAGTELGRRVGAVLHDALVFERALPAAVGATVRAERFAPIPSGQPGHLDETGVELRDVVTAPLQTGSTLDGEALGLLEMDPATFAPAATPPWFFDTLTGAEATGPPPAAGVGLIPSRFVILSKGGEDEHALIRSVSARVRFDRDLGLAGQVGLDLFQLTPTGIPYGAAHRGGFLFSVLPEIGPNETGAGTPVQMPRFRPGDLVRLRGTGFGNEHLYRVDTVERHGTTIGLTAGPALPLPVPNDVRVQRLEVVNPATGGTRRARNGRDLTAVAGVTRAIFDVWNPDALTPGLRVAVVSADGRTAAPALVGAVDLTIVTFASAPRLAPPGNVNVSLPGILNGAYSTTVRQDSSTQLLIVENSQIGVTTNPVVVIPLRATNERDAVLSCGSTYVPNDVDDNEIRPMEIDRRQALIDHELRHTEQSALLGPWLLGFFPNILFELFSGVRREPPQSIFDIADVPVPRYSAYVDAVIEATAAGDKVLVIQDTRGVEFAQGDLVQIAQNRGNAAGEHEVTAVPATDRFRLGGEAVLGPVLAKRVGVETYAAGEVTQGAEGRILQLFNAPDGFLNLGDRVALFLTGQPRSFNVRFRDGDRYALQEGADVLPGPVRARRAENAENRGWQGLYDVFNFLTAGGVAKFLFSLTWGGVIEFGARIGFWIDRLVTSEEFSATVEDGGVVLRFSEEVPGALEDSRQVLVLAGDRSVVRAVTGREGAILRLGAGVELGTTDVKVSPYPSQSGIGNWDWHKYYNATVPDPSRPAAVRIETSGDGAPTFAPMDRVHVLAGERSASIRVTGVRDGFVELEEPPPTEGTERRLRLAESRLLDNLFKNLADRPVFNAFFDPWGVLLAAARPESTFAKVMVKIGQVLFSTRQWSVLPFGGYYFWDNLPFQIAGTGFKSTLEQDASEESGDLYTPLSRLRPDPGALARVGDLGLFWYWPWSNFAAPGPDRRTRKVWQQDLREAAGINEYLANTGPDDRPRVLPSLPVGASGADVNNGASAASGTGTSLPDMLVLKAAATPDDPTETGPASFVASDRGIIPSPPRLERVSGAYVAFCEPSPVPGNHRVSVANDIDNGADAREAQQDRIIGRSQQIYFDVTVADVDVTAGGQRVDRPAGTPPVPDILTLVFLQRAALEVSHQNEQHVFCLLRPESGAVVQADGDRAVVAQVTAGTEPAEVCRFYPFTPSAAPSPDDPTAGTFAEARLAAHGMHMPTDLYVPVRRFQIQVVDALPVRSSIPSAEDLRGDVQAAAAASLAAGGEGFILVPSPPDPTVGDVFTLNDAGGNPIADPATVGLAIDAGVAVPEELRPFLGAEGIILRVQVDAGATVPASFTLDVPVRRDAVAGVLHAALALA